MRRFVFYFFFFSVGEVCIIKVLSLNDENYKLATNDRVPIELHEIKNSTEFRLAIEFN